MKSLETTEKVSLWTRHHVRFLMIAYAFSWVFWVVAWVSADGPSSGGVLFNADLVWAMFFDDDVSTSVLWLSLLSLVGVYGPMIGGIVATRLDPAVSTHELRRRTGRVARTCSC